MENRSTWRPPRRQFVFMGQTKGGLLVISSCCEREITQEMENGKRKCLEASLTSVRVHVCVCEREMTQKMEMGPGDLRTYLLGLYYIPR